MTQDNDDNISKPTLDGDEEDIAKKVLDDILNMNGIEKYVQAQNVFKVNGKKTAVRISNKGITIFFKRSLSCLSLQNRYRARKSPF